MVELLQLNPHHSFQKMARCVQTLLAIGSELALTAIAHYATAPQYEEHAAYALRGAIAGGIFVFDPDYYCQQVLAQVKSLYLSNTQVSDAGLVHLNALPNLQSLYLRHTQVSDAGLVHLNALSNLIALPQAHPGER